MNDEIFCNISTIDYLFYFQILKFFLITDDTQKTQKFENTCLSMSCTKRVSPVVHTNTSPIMSKSVISSKYQK